MELPPRERGHHVVEGEFAGRQRFAAVLAGVAVAQQDVLAREGAGLVGDAAVFKKANDRGHGDDGALRVQREAVLLLSARNALEHQHQGAARAADVDGLIGSIEHQHRHLQDVDVRVLHGLVAAGQHYGLGNGFLLARVNHGFSQRHLFSPGLKRWLLYRRSIRAENCRAETCGVRVHCRCAGERLLFLHVFVNRCAAKSCDALRTRQRGHPNGCGPGLRPAPGPRRALWRRWSKCRRRSKRAAPSLLRDRRP